jgi:hypothetical protein
MAMLAQGIGSARDRRFERAIAGTRSSVPAFGKRSNPCHKIKKIPWVVALTVEGQMGIIRGFVFPDSSVGRATDC